MVWYRNGVLNSIRCNLSQICRTRTLYTMIFNRLSPKPRIICNPIIQRRSHYWVSGLFGKQTEITLKNIDRVPNELKMIYRNDDVDVHLKWLYLAVCILSGLVVGFVVVKVDEESVLLDEKERLPRYEFVLVLTIFVLCFMLFHGCMRRMPVRIYQVPKTDKYIFIFNSSVPLDVRKLHCKIGECVRVDTSNYPFFLRFNDIYKVRDEQQVYMFDHAFKKPAYLHVMLGEREDFED